MPLDAVTPELRRYLLGGLDEAGASALEARYVADAPLLDAIRDEEDALVADYLADRLTAVDRARFERHYLASPVHRDRVALARALDDRLAAAPRTAPATTAFYGWMTAAAAVVLLGLWLVSRQEPLPQQAQTPAPAPAPPSPPQTAPAPGPRPSPVPPQPSVLRAALALTLTPIATRGGDQPVHRRPDGPIDLLLRLEGAPVPGDRTYDAEVQTVEGRVAWRGRVRPAAVGSGLLTTLLVPAERLVPDDYVVVVTAPNGDERGRYTLRLRGR